MKEVKGSDSEREKDAAASSGVPISDDSSDNAEGKKIPLQRRMTRPTRRSKGGWTEEEDEILATAVQKFNGKKWKKIAECVPNRMDAQCLHRWHKVLDPGLVKGPWSKEEDEIIAESVRKHQGKTKWAEIAVSLPGRIGKQCRERWYNHLNPEINRNPWTQEEEFDLVRAHKEHGNQWAKISKVLHGRSENAIKNHWNCSMNKKLKSYSQSGIFPGTHKTEEGNKKLEPIGQKVNFKPIHGDKLNDAIKSPFGTPSTRQSGKCEGCNSPESILRSAARSYKNIPSIIRNRGLKRSRQWTASEENSVTENSSLVHQNAEGVLISPPKIRKPDVMKSVEKRLEFE